VNKFKVELTRILPAECKGRKSKAKARSSEVIFDSEQVKGHPSPTDSIKPKVVKVKGEGSLEQLKEMNDFDT